MKRHDRRRHLICYDISDKKRLAKVAKICVQSAVRLQYSVYEAHLNDRELRRVLEQLRQIIHGDQDDLRIYGIHQNGVIQNLGRSPILEDVHWLTGDETIAPEQRKNATTHLASNGTSDDFQPRQPERSP